MLKRISSAEELSNLVQQAKAKLAEQEKGIQVKVHLGTCGISSGAQEILEAFTREIESRKLPGVAD